MILGTDLGTTGAKTTVFTTEGEVVASGYAEYQCDYPHPLWVEQDANMLLAAAKQTMRDAVARAGVAKEQIASIGFSTQRSCALFLDEAGAPLKMISWQDSRTGEILDDIRQLTSEERFYEISGLPLGNTWILPKILWVRAHDAALWEKTQRIVQLHDFILKNFGAQTYVTPETDAGMTGFFNVDDYTWNEEYLRLFELNRALLPEVGQVGAPLGTISDEVADEVGLPRGLALTVGAGDISSAAVGAGVVRPGDFLISMGTGGMMVAATDRPARDPLASFLITDHAIHGMWQWEGLQKGSAGCYRWYRDVIATDEKLAAEAAGRDVYDVLNEKTKDIPPGSDGVIVLPFFASAGTPRWDAYARACILGLTFAHDKYHIARAVMEGVALEYQDMLASLEKSGISPQTVRVSGGPAKSDVWNQLQADIYGKPVETLAFPDASVLGAAIDGAVGAGVFASTREATDALVKPGRRYEPIAANVAAYKEVYKAYVQAYEGLAEQDCFRTLDAISKRA